MFQRDTIFALSSGQPPAAIAVIRVSGPRAGNALQSMMGRLPKPREGAFARLRDPNTGEVMDEALALWFPAPGSETGENVAELQIHGGRAVIAATLSALSRIEGLRPAEPGEFTRRAFENGKLDLTRVEGLADLIAAETEVQRRQALRQLRGALGDQAEAWRGRLTQALALMEAQIDFADEDDVPDNLTPKALDIARELIEDIGEKLKSSGRSERLRDGLVVAIAGPPNAGKSSLLNVLAKRDVAIVSPYAGTTRDVIEVHLDLRGYPVTLLDTAGVRESSDPVEQEGIRRARSRTHDADLVLWLQEASTDVDYPREFAVEPASNEFLPPKWFIRTKSDVLGNLKHDNSDSILSVFAEKVFLISSRDGFGIPELINALSEHAQGYFGTDSGIISRARQRSALEEVKTHLLSSLEGPRERPELVAEDLRLAARGLSRLTGRIDVEDVLDVIFRDFCIGK